MSQIALVGGPCDGKSFETGGTRELSYLIEYVDFNPERLSLRELDEKFDPNEPIGTIKRALYQESRVPDVYTYVNTEEKPYVPGRSHGPYCDPKTR